MAQQRELPPISIVGEAPGVIIRDISEEEANRFTIVGLREVNECTDEEAQKYVDFLNDPRTRIHFAHPPKSVAELRRNNRPRSPYHSLLALDGNGDIMGGATIDDASPPEHDHFLSLVVVDPDRQDDPDREHRELGIEIARQAIDWACVNPTFDGRMRSKIDVSIIEVPGWERMRSLVERLEFTRVSTLKSQIDVLEERPGGIIVPVPKNTRRYERMLDTWRSVRGIPSIAPRA